MSTPSPAKKSTKPPKRVQPVPVREAFYALHPSTQQRVVVVSASYAKALEARIKLLEAELNKLREAAKPRPTATAPKKAQVSL